MQIGKREKFNDKIDLIYVGNSTVLVFQDKLLCTCAEFGYKLYPAGKECEHIKAFRAFQIGNAPPDQPVEPTGDTSNQNEAIVGGSPARR